MDASITDITRAFAREAGYVGDSPAMLGAFERIRQSGIVAARRKHDERRQQIEQFKRSAILLDGYLNLFSPRPMLSMQDAIDHYAAEVARQQGRRERKHWSYDPGRLAMAAERVIVARYFRRFGQRIRQRRAA